MKNTFSVRLIYHFYHNAVKAELKKTRVSLKIHHEKIAKNIRSFWDCAKDIGSPIC